VGDESPSEGEFSLVTKHTFWYNKDNTIVRGVWVMSIKAYFSNRIYKKTLPDEYVEAISHALLVFNRAKHFAFNTSMKERRSGQSKRSQSLHLTMKEGFGLDDYYANSTVQEAKAKQKSLDELNKLYMSNKQAQIKSVKNKLKKEKSSLTTLKKIKKSFITGNPSFSKHSKERVFGLSCGKRAKKNPLP
jgi:hypothetical protein